MFMPDRSYIFYALTNSICSQCLQKVEAKIVFRDNCVYLIKHCPSHGREEVLIADDIEYYKKSLEMLKPAEMPLKFNTPIKRGCPYDCGLCPDHEQHSCLTLVEVSDRCNLSCPICYADSGVEELSSHNTVRQHRSLAEIERMLDAIVENEGEPNIVQLSGGEPTIHPQFFEIMDLAKTKPIRHLMINTNGIKIAKDQDFCRRLSEYQPGIEVYLQFDSFEAKALQELRGADLRGIRQQAISNLNAFNISTTLVVTLKKGLNDREIGKIIDYGLQQKCVRGVTFQPIQVAGRLDGFEPKCDRYTLTEVRRSILEQSPYFQPEDIMPVPCHPDCLAMAYALKWQGEVIPLTGLVGREKIAELGSNNILYELNQPLIQETFKLFSASHSPASSAKSLQQLLCCLPMMEVPQGISYENIFRVMIVQFLDPYNFDVRSVKRSCIHIVHPDGRIIPFDTYNLFYREGSQGSHLVKS
jgi:hypothetical protein